MKSTHHILELFRFRREPESARLLAHRVWDVMLVFAPVALLSVIAFSWWCINSVGYGTDAYTPPLTQTAVVKQLKSAAAEVAARSVRYQEALSGSVSLQDPTPSTPRSTAAPTPAKPDFFSIQPSQ